MIGLNAECVIIPITLLFKPFGGEKHYSIIKRTSLVVSPQLGLFDGGNLVWHPRNFFAVRRSLRDESAQPIWLGAISFIFSIALTCQHCCRVNDGNYYIPHHPYDDRGEKYLSTRQCWRVWKGKDISFFISPLLGSRAIPPDCRRYWCTNRGKWSS